MIPLAYQEILQGLERQTYLSIKSGCVVGVEPGVVQIQYSCQLVKGKSSPAIVAGRALDTSFSYRTSNLRLTSVSYRIPNRLRQIVLSRGTDALEAAVGLEADEELDLWAWYSSSYHQYHVAFLLLCEVFVVPLRKEATRIWRCLDFVFAEPLRNFAAMSISETPTFQETIDFRNMKGRYLIATISERMDGYRAAKGLRLPSHFDESMFVATPKSADDSDPRMPLNYGHDKPEMAPKYPTGGPSYIPSSSGTEAEAHHDPSARQAVPSGGIVSQLAHALGPWSNTQLAASEYPMQAHQSIPCRRIRNFGLNDVPVDVEAEMLEIDWNLWDTVFPPQINDGNLDIQDGVW
ncbi:uncharacterized protein BO80DRAFT_480395 [Aspergillus ibericus CBS 121593]|uniref:Uncharacterized protein n=1 Tax=Aspergillus ibericus CBS 121593 TaxID=1448316 RepID=A0A395GRJ8_9EURO|nr:hypothetical protein BO80DRAFT_480395 [Aspergillus ibericus CBS 121593]RAK98069.1 hypothetical protein BO80DRAFT_480395 [Aspergillus ibericus CBS 121593]